jgi:hypothetical protein
MMMMLTVTVPPPLPAAQGVDAIVAAAVEPSSVVDDQLDDSVFTDSFLRSFLLGVGSGVLCEGGHLMWQYLSLHIDDLEQGLLLSLATAANGLAALAPTIVWDHVAAL